jgi:hypothetical protein
MPLVDGTLSFLIASLTSAVLPLALLQSRSSVSFALLLIGETNLIFLHAAIYCTLVVWAILVVTSR